MNRYSIPTDPTAARGLSARLSEAVEHGDPRATHRAILCAQQRGDWQEAERLTAHFYAQHPELTGAATRPDERARAAAAAVAALPLGERINGRPAAS